MQCEFRIQWSLIVVKINDYHVFILCWQYSLNCHCCCMESLLNCVQIELINGRITSGGPSKQATHHSFFILHQLNCSDQWHLNHDSYNIVHPECCQSPYLSCSKCCSLHNILQDVLIYPHYMTIISMIVSFFSFFCCCLQQTICSKSHVLSLWKSVQSHNLHISFHFKLIYSYFFLFFHKVCCTQMNYYFVPLYIKL